MITIMMTREMLEISPDRFVYSGQRSVRGIMADVWTGWIFMMMMVMVMLVVVMKMMMVMMKKRSITAVSGAFIAWTG